MLPSISVVIPLYNKAKEIGRTLNSVLSQSYCPEEIIVIDDGSTDKSADAVKDLLRTNESIKYFYQNNQGVCSARNHGIAMTSGDYVAFLDADDCWDKDYLLEISKMISDFSVCSMWGINFAEVFDGKLVRTLRTGLPSGFRGMVSDYFLLQGRISDLFCSSSVVIRKSAFKKAGLFDTRLKYSEDIDMWWRIIANYPVAFYDRYMVFYNYDADNRAMNRRRPFNQWLPYYPEKYLSFKGNEPFYTFSQRWCGVRIRDCIFGSCSNQEDKQYALEASKKLDLSALPYKYNILFQWPKLFGRLVYKYTCQ